MNDDDFERLQSDIEFEILSGGQVALVGFTPTALQLVGALTASGLAEGIEAIYTEDPGPADPLARLPAVRTLDMVVESGADLIAVTSDHAAEHLQAVMPGHAGNAKVIVAGRPTAVGLE